MKDIIDIQEIEKKLEEAKFSLERANERAGEVLGVPYSQSSNDDIYKLLEYMTPEEKIDFTCRLTERANSLNRKLDKYSMKNLLVEDTQNEILSTSHRICIIEDRSEDNDRHNDKVGECFGVNMYKNAFPSTRTECFVERIYFFYQGKEILENDLKRRAVTQAEFDEKMKANDDKAKEFMEQQYDLQLLEDAQNISNTQIEKYRTEARERRKRDYKIGAKISNEIADTYENVLNAIDSMIKRQKSAEKH